MTTIINGSSPSITFSDSTTQSSGVNTTNPVFTGDASISGLTVGKGAGSAATNTAVGASALASLPSSSYIYNTAIGYQALTALNGGSQNTACGYTAMAATTSGGANASFGDLSLKSNTTGGYNSALGSEALQANTTGSNNVAVGQKALQASTTASNNTAVGYQAGYSNTTSPDNTVIGYQAGYAITTGGYNTFVGVSAGTAVTTGVENQFFGRFSGSAMTTGSKNTILGKYSGNQGGLDIRTASNRIVLSDGDGNPRQYIDNSGNVYFNYGSATTLSPAPSGISMASAVNIPLQIYMLKETQVEAHIGFKSSTDTNFYVGTSGGGGSGGIGVYGLYQQNVTNSWTAVSDERLKTELQPIENALEKVANVRTVTGRYTYDEENGVTRRLPFLIAQDFLTALPEAVDRQDPNKLGLSYSDTIVLAFAAIKELKAEFDAYKATHP